MPQPAARAPTPEGAPAPAVPAQHGLRPDHEQVTSPVLLQAPDEEPDELVPSSEAWTTLGTEGQPGAAGGGAGVPRGGADGSGRRRRGWRGGARWFEHRGRIADPRSRLNRR